MDSSQLHTPLKTDDKVRQALQATYAVRGEYEEGFVASCMSLVMSQAAHKPSAAKVL